MIRRKMTMETTTGRTTIDINYCTAFSIREITKKGVLSKAKYELDIHMQSGTIFTATVTDKELLIFTNLWETEREYHLSLSETEPKEIYEKEELE
jgi:hypothetical protein